MIVYIPNPGSTAAAALPASVVRVNIDYDNVVASISCDELAGSSINKESVDCFLDGKPVPAIGSSDWDVLFDSLSEDYFEETDEAVCGDDILDILKGLSGGADCVLEGTDIQLAVVAAYFDNQGISYTAI